jgi:hypothetical protein
MSTLTEAANAAIDSAVASLYFTKPRWKRTHTCFLLVASLGACVVNSPPSPTVQLAATPDAETTRITLRDICGRQNPQVCIDSMTDIPRDRAGIFRDGGALAIDVVMGDTFPARLARALASIERVASGTEPRAGRPSPSRFRGAWRGASADTIVSTLRRQLPSITITTYDDCPLWRSGQNRAYDGGNGPVPVNRCVEIPMEPADLANTIVHETAHRAGYRHPHMERWINRNWSLANCEPPYLVGSLARSIAASTPITSTLNNCAYLIEQPGR